MEQMELLQQDFPAKTSALQDFVKDWLEREVDCSGKLSESSMKHILNSSSLKMFLDYCHLNKDEIWESSSQRWLTGGMAFAGECWTVKTLESHSGADESSLSQVLEITEDLSKYYLSQKACQGILNRAEVRGKKLPTELKQVLQKQANQ